MILLAWSLVASAVQYARRQRIAALLDNYYEQLQQQQQSSSQPQTLVFSRCESGNGGGGNGLSKAVSDPGQLHSHAAALVYSADQWHIHAAFRPPLRLHDWQLTATGNRGGARPCGSACCVWCETVKRLYFVAHVQRRPVPLPDQSSSSSSSSAVESVNDRCDELALRPGSATAIEVLFSCRQTEFAELVCLWAEKLLRYKRMFMIDRLETVFISQELEASVSQAHTPRDGVYNPLAKQHLTLAALASSSIDVSNVNASASGSSSATYATEGEDSLLERLCLSDVQAARSLNLHFDAASTPDEADGRSTGMSAPLPLETVNETEDCGSERPSSTASTVLQQCPQLLNQLTSRLTGSGQRALNAALSASASMNLTPNNVQQSVNYSRRLSHGCTGSQRRRRSSSAMAHVPGESAAAAAPLTVNTSLHYDIQARRLSTSLSPSPSLSNSALTLDDGGHSRQQSPQPQQQSASRRFSRRRASMSASAGAPATADTRRPPNFLVYAHQQDALADKLVASVDKCLRPDCYTVYRIGAANLASDPWMDHTACLLVADTGGLEDVHWTRLHNYVQQQQGRVLFLCRNSLLTSLIDAKSSRKRTQLLKMASHSIALGADFDGFLKRLSKKLPKGEVCETFCSRDLASGGSQVISITAFRQRGNPLLLCLQSGSSSSQAQATAVFSDASVNSIVSEERSSVLSDALERLQLQLRDKDVDADVQLTPAYLFTEQSEAYLTAANDFVRVSASSGKVAQTLEFVTCNQTNVRAPEPGHLPVIVDCDDEEVPGFDLDQYRQQLGGGQLGASVLYVPVVTSTMHVMRALVDNADRLSDVERTVVVAGRQLQGAGRSGNRWLSPVGCAMFTVCLRLPVRSRLGQTPGFIQHLMALAVCDAVCSQPEYRDVALRIKWPNDIYFGRSHKLGGVLVDCSMHRDHLWALVGCGINVCNERPTVCLNQLLADNLPPLSIEQVIALTLARLEQLLARFQSLGAAGVLPAYYGYWLHGREEVGLQQDGVKETVVVRGLDAHGYLEVRSRQGGRVHSLHPDGNSFDMMHNLIKPK